MPLFLFDTDHVSLFEQNNPQLVQRVKARAPGEVVVSPVSVEEALRGRLAVLARPLKGIQRIAAYAAFMDTVLLFCDWVVVPFDQACEHQFQQLQAQRLRVGTQDLKIAAVVLVNSLTVLTRNRRDFNRVPGIVVDDWSV